MKVRCSNGHYNHFDHVLCCPYAETDSQHIPAFVHHKARQYLRRRCGKTFSSGISLYQCQLIEPSLRDSLFQVHPWKRSRHCARRQRYAMQFYFTIQNDFRYYFTLSFNPKGHRLFAHQIPRKGLKGNKGRFARPCTIYKKALNDKRWDGRVTDITLDYQRLRNRFVWYVEKEERAETRNPQRLWQPQLIYNVRGRLLNRRLLKYFVVCRLPQF
ncbi:MAG: hypothetical protein JNL57_13190 [Bacteroidetes bacterium]|nr:hypothetical protein [Bacteroidota bacterium]